MATIGKGLGELLQFLQQSDRENQTMLNEVGQAGTYNIDLSDSDVLQRVDDDPPQDGSQGEWYGFGALALPAFAVGCSLTYVGIIKLSQLYGKYVKPKLEAVYDKYTGQQQLKEGKARDDALIMQIINRSNVEDSAQFETAEEGLFENSGEGQVNNNDASKAGNDYPTLEENDVEKVSVQGIQGSSCGDIDETDISMSLLMQDELYKHPEMVDSIVNTIPADMYNPSSDDRSDEHSVQVKEFCTGNLDVDRKRESAGKSVTFAEKAVSYDTVVIVDKTIDNGNISDKYSECSDASDSSTIFEMDGNQRDIADLQESTVEQSFHTRPCSTVRKSRSTGNDTDSTDYCEPSYTNGGKDANTGKRVSGRINQENIIGDLWKRKTRNKK